MLDILIGLSIVFLIIIFVFDLKLKEIFFKVAMAVFVLASFAGVVYMVIEALNHITD